MTILVTGCAGAIGRAVVSGLLAGGHGVRGFDLQPAPGLKDSVVGDLSDRDALAQAVAGASALIHLAAVPDDEDFVTRLVPNNLIGLYNVLEAARQAGVKRVVLASTGQVVWWQTLEGPWPVRVDVPYRPRGWYAVTKIAAEMAGQAYARNYGLSVLAVRLGWFPRSREHAEELASTARGPNLYFSPGDAANFFRAAVEVPPEPGFAAVYAASRPVSQAIFDLEPANRLLGWHPQDQWPSGAEHLLARSSIPQSEGLRTR